MRIAGILMVLCLSCGTTFAGPLHFESSYMGHCTDDPAISAEDVVSACTNFISTALQENYQLGDVPQALDYQAQAYERLHRDDKAEAALKASVTRYPMFTPAWLTLGELLERLKGPGMMMATVDAMLHANPNDPDVLNSACWIRATRGEQLDSALADCNESLRLRPGDANTLDSRAFVYLRKRDFAAAAADASSALVKYPKMPSSLYVRGLAKLKSGDPGGGNADIAAAKAIDGKIAETYAGYGAAP